MLNNYAKFVCNQNSYQNDMHDMHFFSAWFYTSANRNSILKVVNP